MCLDHRMNSAFDVVADPARRRLLDLLLRAPRPVGELVAATGLSQPNTSRHLRILREAGLVTCRAAGRHRLYEVRPQGFAELADWLTPYVLLLQGGSGAAADLRQTTSSSLRTPKPSRQSSSVPPSIESSHS
jgi:DNA-binding transcriptional ArsR family regulator